MKSFTISLEAAHNTKQQTMTAASITLHTIVPGTGAAAAAGWAQLSKLLCSFRCYVYSAYMQRAHTCKKRIQLHSVYIHIAHTSKQRKAMYRSQCAARDWCLHSVTPEGSREYADQCMLERMPLVCSTKQHACLHSISTFKHAAQQALRMLEGV